MPTPLEPVIIHDKDSVRYATKTVTEIDTVTVFVEVPAQSAERVAMDSTSQLKTDLAISNAWINADGSLGHNLFNIPQEIPVDVYVPKTSTETDRDMVKVKEVPVEVPKPYPVEKKLTKWEQFRIDAFWFLLGALALSLGWILRKPIASILHNCFRF